MRSRFLLLLLFLFSPLIAKGTGLEEQREEVRPLLVAQEVVRVPFVEIEGAKMFYKIWVNSSDGIAEATAAILNKLNLFPFLADNPMRLHPSAPDQLVAQFDAIRLLVHQALKPQEQEIAPQEPPLLLAEAIAPEIDIEPEDQITDHVEAEHQEPAYVETEHQRSQNKTKKEDAVLVAQDDTNTPQGPNDEDLIEILSGNFPKHPDSFALDAHPDATAIRTKVYAGLSFPEVLKHELIYQGPFKHPVPASNVSPQVRVTLQKTTSNALGFGKVKLADARPEKMESALATLTMNKRYPSSIHSPVMQTMQASIEGYGNLLSVDLSGFKVPQASQTIAEYFLLLTLLTILTKSFGDRLLMPSIQLVRRRGR